MIAKLAARIIGLNPATRAALMLGGLIAIGAGLAWSHITAYQAGVTHTENAIDAQGKKDADDRVTQLEKDIALSAVREANARQRATALARKLKELEDALPPARPGFEFSDAEYRVLNARREAINTVIEAGVAQLPAALRPPATDQPQPHPGTQPDAGLGAGLRPAPHDLRHPPRQSDQ